MKSFKVKALPKDPEGMVFIGIENIQLTDKDSMQAVIMPAEDLSNHLKEKDVEKIEAELLMSGVWESKKYHISIAA